MKDGDAVGEKFNFVKGVGGEEEGGAARVDDFGFEEAAKIGSGEGVQTAGGLVKKQNTGLMQQSAEQAETLHGAGRESADLAIERADAVELFGEVVDACIQQTASEMIQAAEKAEVLTASEPRIKALVGAGVITELYANGGIFFDDVVTCYRCRAAGGQQ